MTEPKRPPRFWSEPEVESLREEALECRSPLDGWPGALGLLLSILAAGGLFVWAVVLILGALL